MTAQTDVRTTVHPTPFSVFGTPRPIPTPPAKAVAQKPRRIVDTSFKIPLTQVKKMLSELIAAIAGDDELAKRIQLLRKDAVWVLEATIAPPMRPQELRKAYTAIAQLQEVQDIIERERGIERKSAERRNNRPQDLPNPLERVRSKLEGRRTAVLANPYFTDGIVIAGCYATLIKTPIPADVTDEQLKDYRVAIMLAEKKCEQHANQAENAGDTTKAKPSSTAARRAAQLAKKRQRTPPPTNASTPGKKGK